MNTDNQILNQTNPVYNTAKLTLSILGSAGVPEAITYAEKLGFTDIRKSFDVNAENKNELPQAITQETRYEFLNRVIRESGCKNIVDVACGFSPRGYIMAKEGYHYLGLDLEASVEALNALADSFKDEEIKGTFRYKACDLTDPDSFEKSLDDMDGEVLIVCEGLLMYFPYFETKSFFEGIKRVLSKHGGRFVTADYNFSDIYVGVHIGLLGQEEGMKTLIALAETTNKKVDTNMADSLVKENGSPEAVKLAEEMEFQNNKIPYYTEAENCRIFEKMDAETSRRLRSVLSQCMAWDITVKTGAKMEVSEEKIEYKATYRVEGEVLHIDLEGRVDSITSTNLMELYTEAKQNTYSGIEIDMTNLQYISSAGLRVLIIMKKEISSHGVKCLHVRPNVMEIFETTGFDSILEF